MRACRWFWLLVLPVSLAQAHVRSESFSRWQYDGQVLMVTFTVPAREAARIPTTVSGQLAQERLSAYLSGHVRVPDADHSCVLLQGFVPLAAREGFQQAMARWRCTRAPAVLEIHTFFDLAEEHAHYARFESGQLLQQKLLTDDEQLWLLGAPLTGAVSEHSGDTFSVFVRRGFLHILSGLDHVVFLLGLLLLCQRPAQLLWAISGFTLGHAATLSLAGMQLVQPNVPAVEAAIGLSIVLVATERDIGQPGRPVWAAGAFILALLLVTTLVHPGPAAIPALALAGLGLFSFCYLQLAQALGSQAAFRILISTLFGLVHGLGFAGAFLAAQWSGASLLVPLLGFNIGVELGQLVLVTVAVACALLLGRFVARLDLARDVLTAVVCGAGVFWFVQRGFG